ncbi:MAG: tRNA (adenosine(37)-N6)-threonylcarbamoyltransferase complex dimerization subunit type 1 TsaB, partial [Armatimonadota bacterium]|nr:tRNA (adenosine(37)-N6)-threonylcarbamoyltransferase complex dimerization subunit type 1 TsaB [Armatimonadota bacterium]
MTFLVMDTSGEYAVLALAEDDGSVRAATVFEGRRSLSRRIMGEMDSLLKNNGLTLQDLSALAVGLGPGSFTGVRVGVTTAKTLAQVTGKPLVGVGTLDAYASVWPGEDTQTSIVPILPSRRGEVYLACYQGGQLSRGPMAMSLAETAEYLTQLQAGDGVMLCGQPQLLPEWSNALSLTQRWTPPEGLARLSARRLAAGEADDLFALVPLYVVA